MVHLDWPLHACQIGREWKRNSCKLMLVIKKKKKVTVLSCFQKLILYTWWRLDQVTLEKMQFCCMTKGWVLIKLWRTWNGYQRGRLSSPRHDHSNSNQQVLQVATINIHPYCIDQFQLSSPIPWSSGTRKGSIIKISKVYLWIMIFHSNKGLKIAKKAWGSNLAALLMADECFSGKLLNLQLSVAASPRLMRCPNAVMIS